MSGKDDLFNYLSGNNSSPQQEGVGEAYFEGDSIMDESLLVSPILADYIGSTGASKKTSASRQFRTGWSKLYEGAKIEEAGTGEESIRVNLESELQLDTSLCPSLGLGSESDDGDIKEESFAEEVDDAEYETPQQNHEQNVHPVESGTNLLEYQYGSDASGFHTRTTQSLPPDAPAHDSGTSPRLSPEGIEMVEMVTEDKKHDDNSGSADLSDDFSDRGDDSEVSFHIGTLSYKSNGEMLSPIPKFGTDADISDDDTVELPSNEKDTNKKNCYSLKNENKSTQIEEDNVARTEVVSDSIAKYENGIDNASEVIDGTNLNSIESEKDMDPTAEEYVNKVGSLFTEDSPKCEPLQKTSSEYQDISSPDHASLKGATDNVEEFVSSTTYSSSVHSNESSPGDFQYSIFPEKIGHNCGSFSSPNTQRGDESSPPDFEDLSSAKKKLDARSNALIQHLRGAAQKRKLLVTRSRDSLAAKEQLMSMASKQQANVSITSSTSNDEEPSQSPVKEPRKLKNSTKDGVYPYKPFKAKPLPETTGDMGIGGQIGIPKVAKKQTTTPFSPKLGPRRRSGSHISSKSKHTLSNKPASRSAKKGIKKNVFITSDTYQPPMRAPDSIVQQKVKRLSPENDPFIPFRARPLPMTTGEDGQGGQVGVPKVEKRITTVAESPCLGLRRKSLTSTEKISSFALKQRELFKKSSSHEPIRPPSKKSIPTVKPEALKAKPFERVLAGSEASHAKEQARLDKIIREDAEARKRTVFRARPFPLSTRHVDPSYETSDLRGLDILSNASRRHIPTKNEENNLQNVDFPSLMSSDMDQAKKKRHTTPTLQSSTRAKERKKFEKRRATIEKENQTEAEIRRQTILKDTKKQLETLRQSLR